MLERLDTLVTDLRAYAPKPFEVTDPPTTSQFLKSLTAIGKVGVDLSSRASPSVSCQGGGLTAPWPLLLVAPARTVTDEGVSGPGTGVKGESKSYSVTLVGWRGASSADVERAVAQFRRHLDSALGAKLPNAPGSTRAVRAMTCRPKTGLPRSARPSRGGRSLLTRRARRVLSTSKEKDPNLGSMSCSPTAPERPSRQAMTVHRVL